MCFATNAQIGYLRMLLQEAGYPHRMGSAYAELGATLREQGGTVEDWLRGMGAGARGNPWRKSGRKNSKHAGSGTHLPRLR